MPCYDPREGYRSKDVNPATGKRSIVFNITQAEERDARSITIACGQCVGCRLERSRQWAMRCVHEASLYENNCFITLTYSDEFLPEHGFLQKKDFQDFMKRLRKRFTGLQPVFGDDGKVEFPIRYFHCGEYGENFGRPHYHACLFNFDFRDKVRTRRTDRGDYCFESPSLSELWPFGRHEIGSMSFESAAYVARYVLKKRWGAGAEEHYEYLDAYGEYIQREREYVTMSRRPGIGKNWIDKFMDSTYPSDSVVMRGVEMKPPKYYDSQYELVDPFGFDDVKFERSQNAKDNRANNTYERLKVREIVQLRKLQQLKRRFENGS